MARDAATSNNSETRARGAGQTGVHGKEKAEEHSHEKYRNAGEEEKGKNVKGPRSKIVQLWSKLGLDLPTAMMMMKAAIPPTIALAMYQADAVAQTYSTLGYLVAIISILGFCIMPRAKFIQTMTMNVLVTCVGAAISLLAVWSGVKARLHTTPQGSTALYNSSQSAVCGIWLFVNIYLVNSVKAKYPQLAFPALIYAIEINVAAAYGPQFQTAAQAESFIRRLLISFLTGFALATGVSLLIFPTSCRTVVGKEITGYVSALRGALKAHGDYFRSLETTDMFERMLVIEKDGKKKTKPSPEVEAVKNMTTTFTEVHAKLASDLPFAKREFAYGKLTPEDYEAIFKHLRAIMMPMMGLSSLIDLFSRSAEINKWDGEESVNENEELREMTVNQWNQLMQFVHEPFATIIQAMDDGLQHALLRLAFIKPPKSKKVADHVDLEDQGDTVTPGNDSFVSYYEKQISGFYEGKQATLSYWLGNKGLALKGSLDDIDAQDLELQPTYSYTRQRNQKQLFAVLYVIFLLHSVSLAVLDFVKFADKRNQVSVKKKLIRPGPRRLRKWLASIFRDQDTNPDDTSITPTIDRNNIIIYMGQAFSERKDPEHLPPSNIWENFGNCIRGIFGFFRSSESAFGFRSACATMTIAITAYLRDTQSFFLRQRLVWAMIMVALSMTPTAGFSVFSFLLRILGTAIAMIVALLIWYIPGQQTAGVIVFLWVFVSLAFYVPLKRADLVIVGMISVVTTTMIIGYELQVRKIGEAAATSNGQPYYPIYLLGPYRLACVVGGLAVAFIWTFFPFPITEHSAMRQKLGGALYLSANYYSIMHETVMARIRDDEGDISDASSPGAKLAKARNKVFAKQMLTLQGLKTHSQMVGWEFPIGGKFPKEEYEKIIEYVTNIVNYTALLGYASSTFSSSSTTNSDNDSNNLQWLRDFRRIISSANLTSHEVTSLLALLSSSISNAQPLPPYLAAPPAYALSRRLEVIDRDILSLRHVMEEGYAAFAVLQISTRCVHMDIEKLLKSVRRLVGELDFSFHVVSTKETKSSETLVGGKSSDQEDLGETKRHRT